MPYLRLGRVSPQRKHTRGQSLVEFAIILPVLLLILLIAIDVGRLFFGWVNLTNMARIAASFAAEHPGELSSGDPTITGLYENRIADDASTINCTLPSTIPAPTFPDGPQHNLNERAQVTLSCGFQLVTPFIGSLIGNPVQLAATAVFPIRAGLAAVAPTPAPTPVPTPTPTPSLGPQDCVVPRYIGLIHADNALAAWIGAGFNKNKFHLSLGDPNYLIGSESVAGVSGTWDGSVQKCSNFELTVGP